MVKIVFLSLLVALLSISLAFADIVHLKDGRTLEGEIILETKDTITLKMALGEVSIKREEIKEIEKKPWTPPEKPEVQETSEEEEKEILQEKKIEELHKKFYQKFAFVDNEYVRLPDFDLRYESSQKRTRKDWLKYKEECKREKKRPGCSESDYYRGIYINEVGDFGVLTSASGWWRVFQILGDDDMIIRRETSDYYLRIKGFPTNGLVNGAAWREGDGWNTPAIACIGTYTYKTVLAGSNTIFSCIPLEQVRKGLTIEQFKEMLKIKGIEETNLSELVKGKKDSEILDLLEKGVKKDEKEAQESPKEREVEGKK
jgi:hypothetical protein